MRRLISHLIPLCGTLGLVLLPRLASAQSMDCSGDGGACPDGFECTTVPAVCPAIACAPNTDCVQPACDTSTYSYCTPKACDPNGGADQCGSTMVCHSYDSTTCSGGGTTPACEPGKDCPAPAIQPDMTQCTTTTAGQCDYKYNLPCQVASDCGDGFDCVPAPSMCACASAGSTGSGTASSSGGTPMSEPAPAPTDPAQPAPADMVPADMMAADGGTVQPTCDCPPSTQNYCKVKEVTCSTDADCLDGWKCAEMGGGVVCAGTATTEPALPPSMDTMAGTGGSSSSGDVPPPDMMAPAPSADAGVAIDPGTMCPQPDPTMVVKQCMPPSYSAGFGAVATDASGQPLAPGSASGVPTGSGGTSSVSESGAPVPAVPGSTDMGTTTGTGSTANPASNGESSSSGGCSFGASAPGSTNAGLLGMMLGLGVLVSRRRR